MRGHREGLRRALSGSAWESRAGRGLLALILVELVAAAWAGQALLGLEAPLGAWVSALGVLLVGAVYCLPAFLLLRFLDRREQESPWLLGGCFLFGILLCPGLTAALEGAGLSVFGSVVSVGGVGAPSAASGPLGRLTLPFVVEGAKLLAVALIWIFARAELDNMTDGLVYGGLVGLGYGLAEGALFAVHGAALGEPPPPLEVLATRTPWFGLSGSFLWTALSGAGLGLLRQGHPWGRAWAAGLCLLAVAGHACRDVLGLPVLGGALVALMQGLGGSWLRWGGAFLVAGLLELVLQAIPYAAFLAAAWWSASWELRVMREQLAGELGSGAITEVEYEDLLCETPFGGRVLPGLPPGRARALLNAQGELAFRKWRVVQDGQDPEQDPLVLAWREDITRLRHE